ncbi:MAG: lipase maturation factor family protein [Deltaproteobacteria bacterium]|nr:lipase maturation factor family protein [Deltaproteobacteria bacterium]
MTWLDGSQYILTRFCFQRALAFVYFIGFLILVNQGLPLLGAQGLLPFKNFLKRVRFWDSPSLFFAVGSSDRAFRALAWLGLGLSVVALTGVSDSHGMAVSTLVWLSLWVLYLSFVNIGQTFYGFGWETLLLETAFLAIFLGSNDSEPPVAVFWLLRWVLFRVMFGAGLIKLRGDPCWRDLTCMNYHYETQPIPNPLSYYLHRLPEKVHKFSVLFTHFVELIVPFGLFGPGAVRWVAGGLTLFFQLSLILSGNLSWLNYITLVLTIACFDDRLLGYIFSFHHAVPATMGWVHVGVLGALGVLIFMLSIKPTINLFSRRQIMNTSFEPLHLVNTYGAFGSITRDRMELVIEGTSDSVATPQTRWLEYEFKAKPGNPARRLPIVSPYHYRLDWQMWFAAMSGYENHPWILNLLAKLLRGDARVLGLMAHNPFPNSPPRLVRVRRYYYCFTELGDKSGHPWQRALVGEYLRPLSLHDQNFLAVLRDMQWLEA